METFFDRIERFKSLYITSFGVRKFEKISSIISNSNNVNKLIALSDEKKQAPLSLDYIYSISSIPYFIFSRGDTKALGAILAFEKWMKLSNKDFYYTNRDLNITLDAILFECSKLRLTIRV